MPGRHLLASAKEGQLNILAELRIHAESLASAVKQDPKFFAAVTHYVQRLRDAVATPNPDLTVSELQLLSGKIEAFWERYRSHDVPGIVYFPPPKISTTDDTVIEINRLVRAIAAMPADDFSAILPERGVSKSASAREQSKQTRPCIFIGHGRNSVWARVKSHIEDDLNLAVVTYEAESRTGESIVPVLEMMLDQATFAVIVLTAEDETAEGSLRPRLNVVHEAGLFQGRLGFKRAVLLVQQGVETFSNVDGLQHIPFTGGSVEQSFYELGRALRREGQIT